MESRQSQQQQRHKNNTRGYDWLDLIAGQRRREWKAGVKGGCDVKGSGETDYRRWQNFRDVTEEGCALLGVQLWSGQGILVGS